MYIVHSRDTDTLSWREGSHHLDQMLFLLPLYTCEYRDPGSTSVWSKDPKRKVLDVHKCGLKVL